MEWTDERVERLKELYITEGLSAGQVCRVLSEEVGELISRNMVLGKIHRMRLLRHSHHPRAKDHVSVPRPPKPTPAPKPGLIEPAPVMDVDGRPFTLENARYGQCRWMPGNVLAGDMTICAHPTVRGKSWCSDHLARISDRTTSKLARERAKETVPTVKALALRRAS